LLPAVRNGRHSRGPVIATEKPGPGSVPCVAENSSAVALNAMAWVAFVFAALLCAFAQDDFPLDIELHVRTDTVIELCQVCFSAAEPF